MIKEYLPIFIVINLIVLGWFLFYIGRVLITARNNHILFLRYSIDSKGRKPLTHQAKLMNASGTIKKVQIEHMLGTVLMICNKYSFITVADVLAIFQIPSIEADEHRGWTELHKITPVQTIWGWVVEFPPAKQLSQD
jgi:hypothetical protein